ncbi:MAG TPA: hypothetical protein VJG90_04040 [Candidatus Nanoarchaeia archaeon]|nr:hypothetical protein [Candidatus Nanoarchaeia archaeon]
MQLQQFNPTLKTLRTVEAKLKELGAVKSINELKEELSNKISHQTIKECLIYLEEKKVIITSISGGVAYAPPRDLSRVKNRGITL